MELLYFLLIILWVTLVWLYIQSLKAIQEYSVAHGVEVFGFKYRGLIQLSGDPGFLNELWRKDAGLKVEDESLAELIKKAHKYLRITTYLSVGSFFSLMIMQVLILG